MQFGMRMRIANAIQDLQRPSIVSSKNPGSRIEQLLKIGQHPHPQHLLSQPAQWYSNLNMYTSDQRIRSESDLLRMSLLSNNEKQAAFRSMEEEGERFILERLQKSHESLFSKLRY